MSTVLTGEGYIVYKRTRNKEENYNLKVSYGPDHEERYYWFKTHAKMAERLDKLSAGINTLIDTGAAATDSDQVAATLKKLGESERQKEIRLLNTMGFTVKNEKDIVEIIRRINELMIGKQAYERALEQIEHAKYMLTHEKKKTLAPSLSSLYAGKLSEVFGHKLDKYIANFLATVNNSTDIDQLVKQKKIKWKKIEQDISNMYDEAIEEAFIGLFEKKTTAVDEFGTYWSKEEYDQFREAINDTHLEALKQRIHSRINLKDIQKTIKEQFGNLLKSNKNIRNKGGRSAFEIAAKLKKVKDDKKKKKNKDEDEADNITLRVASIGGTVDEIINMIKNMLPGTITIGEGENKKEFTRVTHSFKNEIQKIDRSLIISTLSQTEIEQTLKEMEEATDHTESLIDAEKRLSAFYNEKLKNLNDTFIIFTNDKAYTMNSIKEKGFSGGSKRHIDDLQVLLTQGLNIYNVKQASELITYIKNTIHNAYLDSDKNRSVALAAIKNVIRTGMVHLLFDDWIAIGKQDVQDNAIHVLTLDGVNIPSSVLFLEAAQAYEDTINHVNQNFGGYFSLTLNYPKNILYPEPPLPIKHPETNVIIDWEVAQNGVKYPTKTYRGRIVPDVRQAWENQKKDVASNFTFSYRFLRMFYILTAKLIDDLRNNPKI